MASTGCMHCSGTSMSKKLVLTSYDATAVGRRSLVKKNNTGGGRGCFGRRPTWDQKQRWMGDECDENPTVNSMPRGLKYSAGHNHDDDLDSVVLVGVVGVSNGSSLGRLSLVKSSFDHDLPATWISPQRPWRYHDTPPHFRTWYSVPSRTVNLSEPVWAAPFRH